MNWSVLGIEETKDKKAITAAYRKRLAQVNPEDKPEEFKELRAAYEEALRLADMEETVQERDETPLGLWMEKVRALYNDFAARIRPENWRELLEADVCVALDVRPETEDRLLRFLMEDYYLPQSVWLVLDETFGWSERRQELYEHYAKDFVDYAVVNGIRYPAALPYELFVPGRSGKDCDQYRRLYHQANQCAPEESAAVLGQMEQLSEWHPYGQALIHRMEIANGAVEKGREGYRRLADQYPDNMTLTLSWANLCVEAGESEESERLARRVLEMEPDHWQAKWILSQSLDKQDRQDEAKSLIFELIRAAGGDQKQIMQLMETVRKLNETLIIRRETVRTQEPEDENNIRELAWCYLQNDREEDALRLCRALSENHEDRFDYHRLFAKASFACKEYDEALIHVQKVQEIIAGLVPDGTKETSRRIGKLPEMLQMEGSCYLMLERKAEAIEKYEQAVAAAPEDAEVLTKMAHLLISERQYERATGFLERLIDLRPGSYHGYLLMATCLYELRRDRDAFDAVNRALELERGDLGVYLLRMRILLRNGVWDGVRSTLDFLRQNGIENEITMAWCEAQMMEFETKDFSRALELYQEIAVRIEEKGEYLQEAPTLYYRITILTAEGKDAGEETVRNELIAILDKGLAHDADDFDCIDYKAWLLKRGKRNEEALELYHKLEAVPRRNLNIERELAELYYRDLSVNAEKALHYYLMLMEDNAASDLCFYIGTCKRYLGDYEGAESIFLKEQQMDPKDIDGYNGLTYVYEAMGRYEEALVQAEKTIEIVREREGDQSRFYWRKVQILRRLNRPLEAMKVVDEICARYGYREGENSKFEIACQFGLWSEAEEVIKQWKGNGKLIEKLGFGLKTEQADDSAAKKKKEALNAEIKLLMYRGQVDKARSLLARSEKKLKKKDYEELKKQMAELDGDAEYLLKVWAERAENREENTHELMNLAQVCWWSGRIERAKEYAKQTLDKLDEILKKRLPNEALYRGRRCLMLAMLGREAEARAELEQVRKLPLCIGCSYCSCKDADDFEAFIEEICGNYEKALELHRAGAKRWPDDLDFVCRESHLKRKGF